MDEHLGALHSSAVICERHCSSFWTSAELAVGLSGVLMFVVFVIRVFA
jgi:hypothetical protein